MTPYKCILVTRTFCFSLFKISWGNCKIIFSADLCQFRHAIDISIPDINNTVPFER